MKTSAGQWNQSEFHSHGEIYHVAFDQPYSYPVCFTRDIFNARNDVLVKQAAAENCTASIKSMVFIDQGLIRRDPGCMDRICRWFAHQRHVFELVRDPVVFPGGEAVKNGWDHVNRATSAMNDAQLDRHGMLFAVGGGALLDMAGFAAAIFHRGIQLVRIPTTTLAQDDAGIGVKNGINQYSRKNCIGTFYLPKAVINDFYYLRTLPFDHFIGGVAEAFKIALIRDSAFFKFLENNCGRLKQRDDTIIEQVIKRCAVHHLDHISKGGDAFETGSSRPLDFGHWSAHKIEMLSGFTMGHGQAVSVGVALDAFYAWKIDLISKTDLDRIIFAVHACGLPVWSRYLEMADASGRLEIQNGLEEFRQHLGGRLTFTMPDGIGRACELHDMDFNIVRQGISFLKSLFKNHT